MPRIPDARPVFEIADPPLRPPYATSYQFRLLVARNLAGVVNIAHSMGIVVGDMNGGNFLVNTSGRVSQIDVESLQVNAGGSVHRCLVGTPEYTPPELQGIDLGSLDRTKHHDAFGLAVLTFELLAGHHPFLGRSTEPGRAPNLAEAIQRGLWPHAPGGRAEYLVGVRHLRPPAGTREPPPPDRTARGRTTPGAPDPGRLSADS
jgi:DNA-binding helix-hairpin-helix protein with protein kinase domain